MENTRHFRMVDLETASLSSDAVVWEVGVCDYSLYQAMLHREIEAAFRE